MFVWVVGLPARSRQPHHPHKRACEAPLALISPEEIPDKLLLGKRERKIFMGQIKAKAASVLDAPSAEVYATIADYRQGHPAIIPEENFYDLQVEQGGYGAGTIIRFKMKALGVERTLYQRVSEPEPGHVLIEQDIDSSQKLATTFTVTPLDNGERSHVEISTTLNASPGLMGIVERIVVPLINPRIYRKEMKKLEAVARERKSVPV